MLDNPSKGLDNLSKPDTEGQMCDVAQASAMMREAFPKERHGTVQAACWAAYRQLKLSTERRARAIWHGEAKRIDAHEMQAIRKAALDGYINQRNRAVARIEALENAARRSGADVHSAFSEAASRTD